MKKSGWIISGILGLVLASSLNFVSAQFSIANVLNQWASMGVFAYILPFLLVFAVIYGILSSTKILGEDQKMVNAIIALALGLLSLVGDYVPRFFQALAPNLGIALSVLLAAMILLGLFMGGGFGIGWVKYILLGIGAIAIIAVIVSSFSGYPTYATNLWDQYGPGLITLLILVVIIILIVRGGKKS